MAQSALPTVPIPFWAYDRPPEWDEDSNNWIAANVWSAQHSVIKIEQQEPRHLGSEPQCCTACADTVPPTSMCSRCKQVETVASSTDNESQQHGAQALLCKTGFILQSKLPAFSLASAQTLVPASCGAANVV